MGNSLPRKILRLRRTTLLIVGCIAVLLGLGVARFGATLSWYWLPLFLVVGLIAVHHRRWYAIAGVVLLGGSIGLMRGTDMMQAIAPYKELVGQKVVLQAVATEDATYGTRSQLTFDANNVQVVEPAQTVLPGTIKLAGFGTQMVYRGDVVQAEGKLYATRGSRQAGISFADIHVQGRHTTAIDTLRRNFAAGMQNALPEPLASFALGLLIGQRDTLPDATASSLATVGLTHIIAVSGYNLTIIIEAVRRLMGKRSKYQTVLAAVVLMSVFVLVTGFSASIVRASLVSGLGLLAWYYGRSFRPVLLISMAAAMTALWNPLYLWSDIGWYLSFLAFFGVLVIAPVLMRRLYKQRQPGLVGSVLLETTCAQLMTLPLILYIFQQISFVSLLSNLLVVPMVPIAMLLGVIAGVAGMGAPAVAGWFAWPARFVLTYMLDIAALLARVPHALAKYSLSLRGLLYLYAVMLLCLGVLQRKVRQKYGKITDIDTTT